MFSYVSFEDLKQYRGVDSTEVKNDPVMRELCAEASRSWDRWTHRKFYPRLETRYYNDIEDAASATPLWGQGSFYPSGVFPNPLRHRTGYQAGVVGGQVLLLDDELLEVVELKTANGATIISSSDYFLKTGENYNLPPYDRIELNTSGSAAFTSEETLQRANSVRGYWGYHEDWANAWLDSGDTVEDNPLVVSATSMTVNDVDGEDGYGRMPRFKAQTLLKIESEYVLVLSKNATSNTVRIKRAMFGTVAAEHAQNTPIYIYQPMDDIVYYVTRLARWFSSQRNASSDSADRPTVMPSGMLIMPSGLPKDVKDAVLRFERPK